MFGSTGKVLPFSRIKNRTDVASKIQKLAQQLSHEIEAPPLALGHTRGPFVLWPCPPAPLPPEVR